MELYVVNIYTFTRHIEYHNIDYHNEIRFDLKPEAATDASAIAWHVPGCPTVEQTALGINMGH